MELFIKIRRKLRKTRFEQESQWSMSYALKDNALDNLDVLWF